MKKLSLTGVGILIVGALIVLASLALNGFKLENYHSNKPLVEKKIEEAVKDIYVNLEREAITISQSPDDKIHITYQEDPNQPVNIKKGDSLELKEENQLFSWDWTFWKGSLKKMTITLPKNFNKKLGIDASVLNLTGEGIAFDQLMVDTAVGDINLSGLTGVSTVVSNTNGETSLSNLQLTDAFRVESVNGTIQASQIKAGKADISNVNGSAALIQSSFTGDIHMSAVNGDIAFSQLTAGMNLDLENVNGNIAGDLLNAREAFSIYSDTVHGSSNLPEKEAGGNQRLRASVVNGDIIIDFAK